MSSTVIHRARRILTMNPANPEAKPVAVRDGRILGAGPLEDLKGWGEHTLDERFADKVLMPGFVEGHSHTYEGGVWAYPHVGFFDCMPGLPRVPPPKGSTCWPMARSTASSDGAHARLHPGGSALGGCGISEPG